MKYLLAILFTVLLASCGFGTKKTSEETSELPKPLQNFSAKSPQITIMTWNVENLYDSEDDPKKLDDTYLPLATKAQIKNHNSNCLKLDAKSWREQCLEWDWTEAVVDIKLQKLAQVILSVNNGLGPDFLALQEVENLALLERLIKDFLPNSNYRAYLIENNDSRGIDVGVLTRLPVLETPRFLKLGNSRPAMQMTVELSDGTPLAMTVVHFPIATSPIKKRLEFLSTVTAQNQSHFQIVLGDFNFPRHEMDDNQIAQKHLLPKWVPAHLYCESCLGSTYETFTGDWSFLDMILLHQNFFSATADWTANVSSFRVHHPLFFQINKYGSPADFNLPSLRGVSDHWPLVIQLVKTR